MIKLIQYLKGYIKIKIWGYSPERFMNLCSNHNIVLWEVEQAKEYYVMNIGIKGFFRLKPILRKTGTKAAILKKYGLPFLIPSMKKRSIFIIGIFGCILFLMIMSNNLWAIEVAGNQEITTDKFMDFLGDNGIAYGMGKKNIDIEQLEKNIRLQFDSVTWTSVEIQGTKLYIQIKENTFHNKTKTYPWEASDLIAEKDGTIVKMVTRKGIPKVAQGDIVKKGDMLVSGAIPILGEDSAVKKYQYCNADADIYLQCIYPYQAKVELKHMKKVYTGNEEKIHFAEAFGKRIQLPHKKIKYENYDIYTEETQIKILDNYYLPFFLGSTDVREYYCVITQYTEEEAKKKLNDNFEKNLFTLEEKGVQIIEKNVKIEKKKDSMKLTGELLAVELTGTPKEAKKEIIEEITEEKREAWEKP